MVGEAAEGLYTDDVRHTRVDELDHLACQEPSLAGLVSDVNDRLCIFDQFKNAGGGLKMNALFKFPVDRL